MLYLIKDEKTGNSWTEVGSEATYRIRSLLGGGSADDIRAALACVSRASNFSVTIKTAAKTLVVELFPQLDKGTVVRCDDHFGRVIEDDSDSVMVDIELIKDGMRLPYTIHKGNISIIDSPGSIVGQALGQAMDVIPLYEDKASKQVIPTDGKKYIFHDGIFRFYTARFLWPIKDKKVIFRVRIDRNVSERAAEKGIKNYSSIQPSTNEEIDAWLRVHPSYKLGGGA